MPALVSTAPQQGALRKRKAHVKSRKGCVNCKIRRVKCDEARPHCQKCADYGVSCSYVSAAALGTGPRDGKEARGFALDLAVGEATIDFGAASAPPPSLRKAPVSLNAMCAAAINASLGGGEGIGSRSGGGDGGTKKWRFGEEEMGILKRFQGRTVLTVGNGVTSKTYRDVVAHMACLHPFLMHMVLSLTLLHDTHLLTPNDPLSTPSPSTTSPSQKAALTHLTIATSLYSTTLSHPIPPSHRDPIWAAGALLGTISMASFAPADPNAAWPLKQSDPSDLNWLKLSEGKLAIWALAKPDRDDSVFHAMAVAMRDAKAPAWRAHPEAFIDRLPRRWKTLFGITGSTTADDNVYFVPLMCILHMQGVDRTQEFMVPLLRFVLFVRPEFRALLERKDPRAMLLLLWWFRGVGDGSEELWWMARRARVEGRAVEIWLERWYGGEEGLMGLYERLSAGRVGEGEVDARSSAESVA